MANSPKIDVVIPTYNGLKLLKQNLPSLFKYTSNLLNQVIIVDDGGTDETEVYVSENYKKVLYLKNSSNSGFSKSVNLGVSASKADYIILLNNDVKVQKDFLKEPLKLMEKDKNLFAVNFNETSSSWPLVWWKKGKMQFTRAEDKSVAYYCAWPSGGSALVRRKYWVNLGGLNEIYSPAYWEDIDLGWRAWKAGYKIIWDPKNSVVHDHESTFGLLDKNYLNNLKQRNELLFTWQNFTEAKYILSHLWFLLTYTLLHPGYFKIIFLAATEYIKLGKKTKGILSDTQVLKSLNLPYEG